MRVDRGGGVDGVVEGVVGVAGDMVGWRRELHAHPELAFGEHETAARVAGWLRSCGLEPVVGLAGTGVVAVIEGRGAGGAIALRADLDALPMVEESGVAHASRHVGRMHACGHDGHMAMLLGAAKVLAARRDFNGRVVVVFQPAEEGGGGGEVMVREGLFEQFPVDGVFGLHNWPGLPAGVFGVRAGAVMAATDTFVIRVEGRGGHAAMPHEALDPIVGGAQVVVALQSLVSRRLDPAGMAVVSVTCFEGGSAYNVIPARVVLRGTVRTVDGRVRDGIEGQMKRLVAGVCDGLGLVGVVEYSRGYPATVNSGAEAEVAARAAGRVVGQGRVLRDLAPSMGGEDFAYMLAARPGCYVWMGTGREGSRGLHHPGYDFDDESLVVGASYWVRLVEERLG